VPAKVTSLLGKKKVVFAADGVGGDALGRYSGVGPVFAEEWLPRGSGVGVVQFAG